MAHRVEAYKHELKEIDRVKHCKQKRNHIIDQAGIDLVHCLCDCVHNVLNGNIPLDEFDKKRLNRHRHCMRELVDSKTLDRKRKHLLQEGGILGALIPTIIGLLGSLINNG